MASRGALPALLEAEVNGRTVRVRVTPEPMLEATVGGRIVRCIVTLEGEGEGGDGPSDEADEDRRSGPGKELEKRVTWGSPLKEEQDAEDYRKVGPDPAARRIAKLVGETLSRGRDAQVQGRVCVALRRHVDSEEAVGLVVDLGGVRALTGAMWNRLDRPGVQAGAVATLAEIVWRRPDLVIATVDGGGLGLTVAAMATHPVHAGVQVAGCEYLRALSHDAECCERIKRTRGAAGAAVEGIVRNPKKAAVLVEASMFLQNMATAQCILGSRRGADAAGADMGVVATRLADVRTGSVARPDLASAAFGLFSNLALDAAGLAVLRGSEVATTVMGVVRDHPEDSWLHEIAFAMLCNTVDREHGEQCSEIVELVLMSMGWHSNEEWLQVRACELLDLLSRESRALQVRSLICG